MNALMAKLEYIHEQCQDPKKRKEKDEEMKKWDDFTKLKKKLSSDIKQVREQIQERNELLGKTDSAGNTTTVRMSKDIRNMLKEVMKEADELAEMQKKDSEKLEERKAKGKKVTPEAEEEIKKREEVVELCRKHIEECKRLERSARGNTTDFNSEDNSALITSLPDIDDPGFKMLVDLDNQIDEKLEEAAKGVAVLKDMAVNMGKEIEMQEMMINELDNKVEKTNQKLMNLNKRLKKTLDKVNSGDKFCVDLILIVLILALGGYLYNVFA